MLNQKIKKIAKIASVGVILIGSAIGIIVKENKNTSASQLSTQDYGSNVADNKQSAETEKQVICQNALEESDNDLAIREYSKTEIVDCSSAGCGGLF